MKLEINDIILYYVQFEETYLKSICRVDELNFLGGIVVEELYSLSELKLTDAYAPSRTVSVQRNNIRKNFGNITSENFLNHHPEYNI